MKLALFNVKYSCNLGDGVIAECLEHELTRMTGADVISVDLAGRTEWNCSSQDPLRSLKLGMLHGMPRFLSDIVVSAVLGRTLQKAILPQWRKQLKNIDAVIFGGGQLIQDADLNFPLKIAAAANLCNQSDIPIAVFAVGAAATVSDRAQKLFSHLLRSRQLIHVAARDRASRQPLSAYDIDVHLCRDPGLLASTLWPIPPLMKGGRRRIGLGITHPAVLTHHGVGDNAHSIRQTLAIYAELALQLEREGYEVFCFSNGASEDEWLLRRLRTHVKAKAHGAPLICFAERCQRPEELARNIATCDAVIAHRLHACILAFSYKRPAIGLSWDPKLDAFFASIDAPGQILPFGQGIGTAAPRLLRALLEKGIAPHLHEYVLNETREGISKMADTLLSYLPEERKYVA